MLPAYAGYFFGYENDIILIPETRKQIPQAVKYLIIMRDGKIPWCLEGGVHAWEVSGRRYDRIGALHAEDLEIRLKAEKDSFTFPDARKITEYENVRLEGARHIFPGELQERCNELDRKKTVVTFCGSGSPAVIAASILKKEGFARVEDNLGSMAACINIGCPVIKGPPGRK